MATHIFGTCNRKTHILYCPFHIFNLANRGYCNAGVCLSACVCVCICVSAALYIPHHNFVKCWVCINRVSYQAYVNGQGHQNMKITVWDITFEPDTWLHSNHCFHSPHRVCFCRAHAPYANWIRNEVSLCVESELFLVERSMVQD